MGKLYKIGQSDRDAVWDADSRWSKEPCLKWDPYLTTDTF